MGLLHPSAGTRIITVALWVKLADKFCIKMFQYIEISPAHAGAEAKKDHYNGEQFICHDIFFSLWNKKLYRL